MKLPQELTELSEFEIVELLYAMRQAVKYRAKNKANVYTHESAINTYKFKWTDANHLHLVSMEKLNAR